MYWSVLLITALSLSACDKAAEPAPKPPPTRAIEAVPVAADAKAAPGEASVTQNEVAAVITDRPADPSRMPHDDLHAPYHARKPGGAGHGHPGAGAGKLPAGHPPVGGAGGGTASRPMARPAPAIEKDAERPLPLEGPGSVAELERRLKLTDDAAVRARLESAFRKTFTAKRDKRDYPGAAKDLEGLTEGAHAATAHRIMGYVAVNTGFNAPKAMKHYAKAIELDPKYGDAHYALAFMYVMSDKAAGKKHFDEAMRLGVPDTRGLGDRFFR